MTPPQLPQLVWSGANGALLRAPDALALAERPELTPEDLTSPEVARFMPLPGFAW